MGLGFRLLKLLGGPVFCPRCGSVRSGFLRRGSEHHPGHLGRGRPHSNRGEQREPRRGNDKTSAAPSRSSTLSSSTIYAMQSDQSGTFLLKCVTPYIAKRATPAVVKGGGVGKRSAGKMVILDTSTSESEAPEPKAKSASSGTKSTTTSAKRSAAKKPRPTESKQSPLISP